MKEKGLRNQYAALNRLGGGQRIRTSWSGICPGVNIAHFVGGQPPSRPATPTNAKTTPIIRPIPFTDSTTYISIEANTHKEMSTSKEAISVTHIDIKRDQLYRMRYRAKRYPALIERGA